MSKERVLSGFRPTGRVHIGHYFGTLKNWLKLQNDPNFECYFEIADWHVLTTHYTETSKLRQNTIDMAIDWFSIGIDPSKSVIFVQSAIKEHAELHLLFSMIITVSRLERNPTIKEQAKQLGLSEKISYGFLGYPVLQAVDILMYKPKYVPVGEDQLPHIEITREIARRFNNLYKEIFPIPEPLLSPSPKVLGIDGRKMSKSYNNFIIITEPSNSLERKIMKAFTCPQKIRKNDPGIPEECPIFAYHQLFGNPEAEQIKEDCKKGKIGCVECKRKVLKIMNEFLQPFREKRAELDKNKNKVIEILEEGNKKAREFAQKTMEEVREAMNMWSK